MAGIVFTNSRRFRYGAVVHEPNAAGLERASNNQKSVGVPKPFHSSYQLSEFILSFLKGPARLSYFFRRRLSTAAAGLHLG